MKLTFYKSDKIEARLEYGHDIVAIHIDRMDRNCLREAVSAHDDLLSFLEYCGFRYLMAVIPKGHRIERIAEKFGYENIGDGIWVLKV